MSISISICFSLKIKNDNLHFSKHCAKEVFFLNLFLNLNIGLQRQNISSDSRSLQKCGLINLNNDLVKHYFKECTIPLPKVFYMNTRLKLKKQRYYCKHCKQTHVATTSLVKEHCSISICTYTEIPSELKEKNTVKDIA